MWIAMFVVGAFGFVHLLFRPVGGYLTHTGETPLFTIIGLFLVFGVVSLAFWGYFRVRKPREPGDDVATEAFGTATPSDPAE